MSPKPLISVITPFYNPPSSFFREAIESVLQQSFTAWELLLVDDGSQGECSALAQAYAQKYPDRIKYFEHPAHQNCGMSASRNLGLRHAVGQYMAFLDADDIWLPHTLGEQFASMEAQPQAAMLYGTSEYWHSWTGKSEDARRDCVQPLGVPPNTLYSPPALVPLFLDGRAAVPCPCGVIVRRQVVEAVGGFEEAFQNLYEDQAFYAKVCLLAPVFASDRCWGRYRQHPQSSTRRLTPYGGAERARLAFLDWLEGVLCAKQIQDQEVWEALRRQKWLSRAPGRPGRAYRWRRWAKKWLSRLERRALPPAVRRRLWSRHPDCG